MATYTTQNLKDVREAILKLATGKTMVSVSFASASGSRTVQYRSADMDSLRDLEALINDELNGSTATRCRTVLTRSRKGL